MWCKRTTTADLGSNRRLNEIHNSIWNKTNLSWSQVWTRSCQYEAWYKTNLSWSQEWTRSCQYEAWLWYVFSALLTISLAFQCFPLWPFLLSIVFGMKPGNWPRSARRHWAAHDRRWRWWWTPWTRATQSRAPTVMRPSPSWTPTATHSTGEVSV